MVGLITETFAALGDPVRSTIVDQLTRGDATVSELAATFTISLQAISRHLNVLEDAGIVTRERVGRSRRVHLEPARLDEASDWLEARRLRLEERYTRLDHLLAALDDQPADDPSTVDEGAS